MIIRSYPTKDIARYEFHDKMCDKLIEALLKGQIDSDKFQMFYEYHDYTRGILARHALFKAYLHDM